MAGALVMGLCSAVAVAERQGKGGPAKQVVADLAVVDAEGYQALIAKQRGKPVLVNFWATWCEPCRDEYPVVNIIAKKYAGRGLVVLGVSWDEDGELGVVRRFLTRNAPIFANVRKKPGDNVAFTKSVDAQWSGALPSTFLYTPDGKRFRILVGAKTQPQFEAAVEALLAAVEGSK